MLTLLRAPRLMPRSSETQTGMTEAHPPPQQPPPQQPPALAGAVRDAGLVERPPTATLTADHTRATSA
jgi:hypothetical protein